MPLLLMLARFDERLDGHIEARLSPAPSHGRAVQLSEGAVHSIGRIILDTKSLARKRRYADLLAYSPAVRRTDAAMDVIAYELRSAPDATRDDQKYLAALCKACARAMQSQELAIDALAVVAGRTAYSETAWSPATHATLVLQVLAPKSCRVAPALEAVSQVTQSSFDRNQAILGIGLAACDETEITDRLLKISVSECDNEGGAVALAALYERLARTRTEAQVAEYLLANADRDRLRSVRSELLRLIESSAQIEPEPASRIIDRMIRLLQTVFRLADLQ